MISNQTKFPLASEQLELLLAFARTEGLSDLARLLARDPSVVSRRLQALAEALPVLEKQQRKWGLTALGAAINERTAVYLAELNSLISQNLEPGMGSLSPGVLLVVNGQRALLDPDYGLDLDQAVANIAHLLVVWRDQAWPVVHVHHMSKNLQSPFHPNSPGYRVLKQLKPLAGEIVLEKERASAFTNEGLAELLDAREHAPIVITGFTGNDCIDATARDGAELGYSVRVVSDASASLGVYSKTGEFYAADRVHALMLANVAALYGDVVETAELLNQSN